MTKRAARAECDHPRRVVVKPRLIVPEGVIRWRCPDCGLRWDTSPERDYSQEYAERAGLALGSLAEEAGIDTALCEFCSEPLDTDRPWVRGLDGMGAHRSCLRGVAE